MDDRAAIYLTAFPSNKELLPPQYINSRLVSFYIRVMVNNLFSQSVAIFSVFSDAIPT